MNDEILMTKAVVFAEKNVSENKNISDRPVIYEVWYFTHVKSTCMTASFDKDVRFANIMLV